MVCFPFYDGMFVKGRSGNDLSSTMNASSLLLALLIDFSIPARQPFENPFFMPDL